MFWDNHMHCNFSGDSEADPLDMINVAKAKGLRGITFTDHLDLGYPQEYGFFDLDIENYYPTHHKLALENSTDEFTILTGLEVGLQPWAKNENEEIVKAYPFDFIIGSTHLIDRLDPYFDSSWENTTPEALLTRYYECILENINTFTDFDSLGHLDYAFRYVKDSSIKNNTYEPYKDIVDAILQIIVNKDKALEINSKALSKGMKYPNPHKDIVKRYHELGGKLITIGADAHSPDGIAADFDFLPDFLNECGFTEYAVYQKRNPVFYPLR
ncbi:histidinol-phosphatase (PHP family) [Pseudobutyrivibrio sp. YE44]|uniref:histidinol-phosphatase HisJ family protein n=1 Tax=Pseudobutyrivibrio sp. YE44 TaxID=1520802 RepID=UPI00088343F3|nr:histidinol-phosphatase HisJ family protein [Pseudobutyrivibrio sp. YE44]SDB04513.1 histidinol-phosphatase (PHP family) [Pseudobutyrivibrio sp. YE44]